MKTHVESRVADVKERADSAKLEAQRRAREQADQLIAKAEARAARARRSLRTTRDEGS